MKSKLLFLTIALLSIVNTFAQYEKTTVHYRNGEVKQGFAKFAFMSDKLKFKETKEQKKPSLLTYKELDKFVIGYGNDKTEYQYKIVKGKPGAKLLKVKLRGDVSLYYEIKTSGGAPMAMGGVGGMTMGMGFSSSTEVYYIAKKDDDIVIQLFNMLGVSKKKFKKIVPEFFGDCPELIEKIKNKEYKKRDIVEIVDYYNNECSTK
jgi:hypothetical protein